MHLHLKLACITVSAIFALSGYSGTVLAGDAQSDQTLAEKLNVQQEKFNQNAPPPVKKMIEGSITKLEDSGILGKALNVGDKAPDFELRNAVGKKVKLSEMLKDGPVIVTWYRGSWCPYCNIQLREYKKVLPEIEAAGCQFVAISPELPDSSMSWKQKNAMEFTVLSDTANNVARDYGVVYKAPAEMAPVYGKGGRIDLTKYNGDESMELPLAVTYIIDTDGIIKYAFVDADYRKRAETADVLAAAKEISKK